MAEKRVKLFSNTFMAAAFALGNFALLLLLMWTVTDRVWSRVEEVSAAILSAAGGADGRPGSKKNDT